MNYEYHIFPDDLGDQYDTQRFSELLQEAFDSAEWPVEVKVEDTVGIEPRKCQWDNEAVEENFPTFQAVYDATVSIFVEETDDGLLSHYESIQAEEGRD